MNRIITLLIGILMGIVGFVFTAEARIFHRRVNTCVYKATQQDARKESKPLGSFTVKHFITYPDDQKALLLPKLEITPQGNFDARDWPQFEARIRKDIEASGFAWGTTDMAGRFIPTDEIYFNGAFSLNYDGLFLWVRALGGQSLEYTDDLTIESSPPLQQDAQGAFIFSMGRLRERESYSRTMQLHLPITERNGLSFHISILCNHSSTGVY